MDKLYELKEKLCKELESYADEKISGSTLKEIDTLAHATKNICKIIEAKEEEYSEASYRGSSRRGSYAERGSYEGGSNRGGSSYRGSYEGSMESRWEDPMAEESSYARGRGRGARRDSMGRYSRDDGKHQKVVEELRELQRMSNNELDKEKYDSLIHLVESM